MKEITSPHNSFIKSLVVLRDKSRERRKQGSFIIEGLRELQLATQCGYQLEHLLICPEITPLNHPDLETVITQRTPTLIAKEVFNKLALRTTTEGIIAVAKSKSHNLENLSFKGKNPLILIAEAPEKPGNIGALLRTADAAGIDAVIIANPKTDLYNPNIIRSSVGCVFTSQLAIGSTAQIIDYLKENSIAIYAAILQEAKAYTTQDYKQAAAIVVGTEDQGLSEAWRIQAKACIKIPMRGQIDSMNVSVAAGILVFEAIRQRNNH